MRSIGWGCGSAPANPQADGRNAPLPTSTSIVAGTAGLEPANAGIKIPCLTNLATSHRSRYRNRACAISKANSPRLRDFKSQLSALARFQKPTLRACAISKTNSPRLRDFEKEINSPRSCDYKIGPCAPSATSNPLAPLRTIQLSRVRPARNCSSANRSGDRFTPRTAYALNCAGQSAAICRACCPVSTAANTQPPLPERRAAPKRPSQSIAAATGA